MNIKNQGSRSVLVSILAAVAIVFSVNANAATLSYSASTSATLTDWTTTLSLPLFDSSLGTLTEIQFKATLSLSSVLTVVNNGEAPSSGNAGLTLSLSVVDPGSLFAGGSDVNYTNLNLFAYSLATGDSVTSGTIDRSANTSTTYDTSDFLAEFTGTGNLTFNLGTSTFTILSNNGGNSTETQATTAQGKIQVTYVYVPAVVPEPSTWAMVAGGCAMLVLGLRRKSRRSV